MVAKYILALDQGTTSSRAILFDGEGKAVSSSQRETRQIYPEPGWLEHSATEIWDTQHAVALEAIERAHLSPSDIAAIGVTNQRETTIVWEKKTGRPIANAIVWQDRRTKPLCDELRNAGLAKTISERTGLVVDPYFSATKIRWLLDSVPGAQQRAEQGELLFGTVDSWLVWNLTGGETHATDVTNASRTMLLNLRTGNWDDELLKIFRIPRVMLPKIGPSSSIVGTAVGTLSGIPIAGIAGDQQAALFGQMCVEPGMLKNTYGTGCFLLMNVGNTVARSENQLITTVAATADGTLAYALEGSVFTAGAAVQWLRDGLGIIRSSSEMEPLATSVPDSSGVHFVPAFSGLGAPYWDDGARGTLVGLTGGVTRAHIARATLEAIAFQTADVVLAMQRDASQPLVELRVDGGASVNNFLLQFQADVLGIPVVRPQVVETTALGAAYLAGLAVGVWPDTSQLKNCWKVERRFEPRIESAQRQELLNDWWKAIAKSRSK